MSSIITRPRVWALIRARIALIVAAIMTRCRACRRRPQTHVLAGFTAPRHDHRSCGLQNLIFKFLSKDVFSEKFLNRQKFIGGYRPRCHVEKQDGQEAGWPCDRFISSLKRRIVLILLLISVNQVDSVGRVSKYDFNLYTVCTSLRHGSIINIEN